MIGLLAAFLIKTLLILTGLRLRRLKNTVNIPFMTKMKCYLGRKTEVKSEIRFWSSLFAKITSSSMSKNFKRECTASCTFLCGQCGDHFWRIGKLTDSTGISGPVSYTQKFRKLASVCCSAVMSPFYMPFYSATWCRYI